MEEPDCYICGKAIDDKQASVVIPHLALKLHLSRYERDSGGPRQSVPRFGTVRRIRPRKNGVVRQ